LCNCLIGAVREQLARLQLGGEAQPALESSSEAFMTGAQVATVEDTLVLPAPADEMLEGKVIDTISMCWRPAGPVPSNAIEFGLFDIRA
jgi:hypothetical protein